MSSLILENYKSERAHLKRLTQLFQKNVGPIKIASPYVTDRTLIQETRQPIYLLSSLNVMDIVSGATCINAISWMIDNGVNCKILPNTPRLHSKTYIFGNTQAVISSANLTMNAVNSNIEAGVELDEREAKELAQWFDSLWDKGTVLSQGYLSELSEHASDLRKEFEKLRRKAQKRLPKQNSAIPKLVTADTVTELFETANNFFICNSNRRYTKKAIIGGYPVEEKMLNLGLATAWETFNYPEHMNRVVKGDAILMYAKSVGIIGVGVALSGCETLEASDSNRLQDGRTIEWRVPVKWLVWADEASAYPYKSPNKTFFDISKEKYIELRNDIKMHFVENV